MNPFTTVRGAILTGIVLAVIVLVAAPALHLSAGELNQFAIARWLHILSGVMWIGLLYYFNVVQVPALAAAAADSGGPGGAGIAKYIAPRALLWFRWAAVATWLTGMWYLGASHTTGSAFTLGYGGTDQYGFVIGIGAWLGTIMAINVWAFIWPNQKKVLGLVPATDAEKARARKTALWVSRLNFALSIPLLLCMASASHGLPF